MTIMSVSDPLTRERADTSAKVSGDPVMAGTVCYDQTVMDPLRCEPLCLVTDMDDEFGRYSPARLFRRLCPMLRGRSR